MKQKHVTIHHWYSIYYPLCDNHERNPNQTRTTANNDKRSPPSASFKTVPIHVLDLTYEEAELLLKKCGDGIGIFRHFSNECITRVLSLSYHNRHTNILSAFVIFKELEHNMIPINVVSMLYGETLRCLITMIIWIFRSPKERKHFIFP